MWRHHNVTGPCTYSARVSVTYPFILSPDIAGLPHRKSASTGISRDNCRAQGHYKADTCMLHTQLSTTRYAIFRHNFTFHWHFRSPSENWLSLAWPLTVSNRFKAESESGSWNRDPPRSWMLQHTLRHFHCLLHGGVPNLTQPENQESGWRQLHRCTGAGVACPLHRHETWHANVQSARIKMNHCRTSHVRGKRHGLF
jgi:hypothetical protein